MLFIQTTRVLPAGGAPRSLAISSVVSDYGLEDLVIEVRSPTEANDFSSNLCVQTGSGAHPASCTMGTEVPFPGGKARPGRDADHSPHLVTGLRMSRSVTLSPQAPPWRIEGLLYFRNRVSSGSIVSDYGRDGQTTARGPSTAR
jgi:hypothetical protein